MKSVFVRSLPFLIAASFASASAFAAAPVETLPSGVKVTHTVDGTGAQPKASDTVKVHYRVIEGSRERVQVFEGLCIARKGGGIASEMCLHPTSILLI